MSVLGGDGGLNLPFEKVPGGPADLNIQTHICGGIVLRAAVVRLEAGKHPALVFDFKLANGDALAPITLIIEREELRDFVKLVEQSVDAAIEEARA